MANVMKNQDNGNSGGNRSLRDVKLSLLEEFDPQTAMSVFEVLKEYPEKEWRTILTIARSWIKSGQWGSPRNQIKSVMDWLGGGQDEKSLPFERDEEETIHIYKNIFVHGTISAAGVGASSKTN